MKLPSAYKFFISSSSYAHILWRDLAECLTRNLKNYKIEIKYSNSFEYSKL